MSTYQELIAQKKLLDQQINEARKLESKAALAEVQELIKEFGFTAQQVVPWKPDGKKSAPAKYRDEASGRTWTGRGTPPTWIAGKNREDYRIEEPAPESRGPFLAEMAAAAARN